MSHSFLSTNANEVKPGTFNQHHAEDEGMSIRKSHENPEVLLLYQNFLGQPLGKKIASYNIV